MSSKTEMKLAWCDHRTAKYAIETWYQRPEMPRGAIAPIGIWERDQFIGVIIYGRGATNALVHRYGLRTEQGCELVRVACGSHNAPMSRALGISLRMLKKQYPGLRLVVTFADPTYHHGGIYQATGWLYTGMTTAANEYVVDGRQYHGVSFRKMFPPGFEKDPSVTVVQGSAKHRYLFALDPEMKESISSLALPFPKREQHASVPAEPLGTPQGVGGPAPTRTLQPQAPSSPEGGSQEPPSHEEA
jgi:hypothetical protein